MIIDIQLNQGSAPWSQLREAALAAEEAGFSNLWNLDHFSGEMFAAESMMECFASLAAWAATTSTIGLGTLVANVNNRVPGCWPMLCHPFKKSRATDLPSALGLAHHQVALTVLNMPHWELNCCPPWRSDMCVSLK